MNWSILLYQVPVINSIIDATNCWSNIERNQLFSILRISCKRLHKQTNLLSKLVYINLFSKKKYKKFLKLKWKLARVFLEISNTRISDVSMLGNVHTLILSKTKISDISMLGNVHTLDLSWTEISDISVLKNVHTLSIVNCQNITNIPKLDKLRVLDISYCKNISDVSMLSGLYKLNLTFCFKIKDYSMLLNNVKNLILPSGYPPLSMN